MYFIGALAIGLFMVGLLTGHSFKEEGRVIAGSAEQHTADPSAES